ncbi:hypothetical protein NPIL_135021 [Nephila pilipes]|uniref:Uncharacterized protein n=1 Tax=Nephila pilipes TaxID=299642 RepID=A0A8X6P530_NEPPI|nr:hypothetical protein NPIL_135021 [Nephila pilipes]
MTARRSHGKRPQLKERGIGNNGADCAWTKGKGQSESCCRGTRTGENDARPVGVRCRRTGLLRCHAQFYVPRFHHRRGYTGTFDPL